MSKGKITYIPKKEIPRFEQSGLRASFKRIEVRTKTQGEEKIEEDSPHRIQTEASEETTALFNPWSTHYSFLQHYCCNVVIRYILRVLPERSVPQSRTSFNGLLQLPKNGSTSSKVTVNAFGRIVKERLLQFSPTRRKAVSTPERKLTITKDAHGMSDDCVWKEEMTISLGCLIPPSVPAELSIPAGNPIQFATTRIDYEVSADID